MLLVVGAGLSARIGYPTFDAYAERLVNDFGITLDGIPSDDPGAIAGLVRASLEESGRLSEFHAHLERTFGPNGRSQYYDRVHRLLVGAGFRGVVTTNYDSVLEDAASADGRRCEELDLCAPRPFAIFDFLRATSAGRSRDFVLHLHGYFRNPDRLVMTTGDYGRRYGSYYETSSDGTQTAQLNLNTMHRKVLWALFVTYPVLFVGFSLRDPALRHILEVIDQDFERGRDLDHYAVMGAADEIQQASDRDELSRYGITPIFYPVTRSPGPGVPDDHRALDDLLASLCGSTSEPAPHRRGEDFTARMLAS